MEREKGERERERASEIECTERKREERGEREERESERAREQRRFTYRGTSDCSGGRHLTPGVRRSNGSGGRERGGLTARFRPFPQRSPRITPLDPSITIRYNR